MPMPFHRSFLFAPGNHPRRVEKAFTLAADVVILDLEDSVVVSGKPAARKPVAEALAATAGAAVAARGAGLEGPIDSPWFHFRDRDGFRRAVERSRRGGFQGRLCIHPDQVADANEGYGPTVDEIAEAERVVAAFRAAEATGSAAIELDGRMVDYPIVHRAERLLKALKGER